MIVQAVFSWIYHMSFPGAALLLAVCTGVFFALRERFGRRLWRPAVAALLAVWAAAVLTQTVLARAPGAVQAPVWTPFQSYLDALGDGGQRELLRSDFMNAVLFYPGGLLLAALLPERWRPALRFALALGALAALSAAIEAAQLRCGLGLAQTDDVIHNALGAAAGAAVTLNIPNIPGKKRRPGSG